MTVPAHMVEGGFGDAALSSQSVFRVLMDAMARPGTIHPVSSLASPPGPMSPTAGAIALTLCDGDTPVWLDPRMAADGELKAWLGFHCGAPFAHTPADAHFAFVSSPSELMALENFAQGSQEYPDRSATLVLQVDTLTEGAALTLAGPGIENEATLAPQPLPRHFAEQWKQNHQRFPRGVDIILAAPDAIACLPRTTRIREREH